MICIPIMARTQSAALIQMERSSPLAHILELRIDQINNVNLEELMVGKQCKILVTNRRSDEGGGFSGTERERVELLKEAVAFGADYVDVEVRTEETLIRELSAKIENHHARTKWIISHHDFSGTPSVRTLRRILDECRSTGADIMKIVTYANTMEDNLRVLGLIPHTRRKGQEIIAFCMGEMGRISRVMGALLGSYFSYASLEKGTESAPGQLTVEEMKGISRIFSVTG
ncbi:MAG: type I 3-dehydroquinate dehydratase [Thermodesulfobacteriota bacterium]